MIPLHLRITIQCSLRRPRRKTDLANAAAEDGGWSFANL